MVPRDKTKIRKRQDEDVCPLQRGSGTLWHNCGCRSRASHETPSWDTITPGSFPTRQKELLSHPKQSTDADLLKEVSFYLVLENFKVFLSFKTRFHISPPDLKHALCCWGWSGTSGHVVSTSQVLAGITGGHHMLSLCSTGVGGAGERVGSNLELCTRKADTLLTELHA